MNRETKSNLYLGLVIVVFVVLYIMFIVGVDRIAKKLKKEGVKPQVEKIWYGEKGKPND